MAANPSSTDNPLQSSQASSRRKILRIALLLTFIVMCVLGFFLSQIPGLRPVMIYPYEPPIAQIDNTTVDLGNIKPGKLLEKQFALYNIGGKTLIIKGYANDCDCLAIRIEKDRVAPGSFTHISLVLNPDKVQSAKKFKQTVTLLTNDPKTTVLNFYISGQKL